MRKEGRYVDESGEGGGGRGGEALERVFVAHTVLEWAGNEDFSARTAILALTCSIPLYS